MLSPRALGTHRTPSPCAQDEAPEQPPPSSTRHPERSGHGTQSQPGLICRHGPPGRLHFSTLPPLLPRLGAPGAALRAHYILCQAPPRSQPRCESHNSHHQLPFTCCGLASLSRFPSPELGSAGVQQEPQQLQPQPRTRALLLQSGPPLHILQSKVVKNNKKPQFNPSKTSHMKSWQHTMLLCLPHFLPSAQGCCQHPLQTEAAVYCGIQRGCQEAAALSATLRSLDNPLLPFFL